MYESEKCAETPLSLADFLARFPVGTHWQSFSGHLTPPAIADLAPNLHTATDPVAYLEEIKQTDANHGRDIVRLLLHLDPSALVRNFGEDTALWASVNNPILEWSDGIHTVLDELYGHNTAMLDIASGWDWRRGSRFERDTKQILALYALMRDMQSGEALQEVPLADIVASNPRDGATLSEERVDAFDVIPIEAADYNTYYDGGRVATWCGEVTSEIAYDMWIDAPTGFALMFKGLPVAMLAMSVVGEDEVLIQQLQGLRARRIDHTKSKYDPERYAKKLSSRALAPLDWQKIMVEITEHIARRRGAKKIGILAACNNVWVKPRMSTDIEAHLSLEAAERIYDTTARRLGFSQSTDDKKGNWHRDIHV